MLYSNPGRLHEEQTRKPFIQLATRHLVHKAISLLQFK